MHKEKLYFESTNGSDRICYFKYTPDAVEGTAGAQAASPKAIFQMVHGMAEYAERYEALAETMCGLGYVVYIHSHVGHKDSVPDDAHLGLFLDAHQRITLVEDAHKMTEIAKRDFPSVKVNLFGHSMGSFVVRLCAAKYGADYASLVVCGTGAKDPKVPLGLTVLKMLRLVFGKDHKSKFIDKSSFGSYNDRFKPVRTPYDWVSRNLKNVDDYVASPYCGFLFSVDGYKMLMEVNRDANLSVTFAATPKTLPVFLIAGSDDPVGNYGKAVPAICEQYKQVGVQDCTYKLYEGCRHEILLDDCAAEVRADIAAFVERYNR